MRKSILSIAFALNLIPSVILAQDWDAGLKAYKAGDYETALVEWRPLAEQGNAEAQFNLGKMHFSGQGVPQNVKKAIRWFRPAAEQGIADAQYKLGLMYFAGIGVPQKRQ